jgi:hypothetical protein
VAGRVGLQLADAARRDRDDHDIGVRQRGARIVGDDALKAGADGLRVQRDWNKQAGNDENDDTTDRWLDHWSVSSQNGAARPQRCVPPARGYAIYLVEAGSSAGASDLANLDTGTAQSTFVATRVAGGAYFVRVRASTTCGRTAPSNEVMVTVR